MFKQTTYFGWWATFLDVPTWYNSIYLMLSVTFKYRATFDPMQDENNQFVPHLLEVGERKPTSKDWETIELFV